MIMTPQIRSSSGRLRNIDTSLMPTFFFFNTRASPWLRSDYFTVEKMNSPAPPCWALVVTRNPQKPISDNMIMERWPYRSSVILHPAHQENDSANMASASDSPFGFLCVTNSRRRVIQSGGCHENMLPHEGSYPLWLYFPMKKTKNNH